MFTLGTIEAFGLYVARTSALVLVSPILGEGIGMAGVKVALIAILSLLMFTVSGEPLPEAVAPFAFGVMAMREILIGLAMAMALQAAVLAVRLAGDLVGNEMAFSMSTVSDPVTGVTMPTVTRIYETVFLLGLLAVDGHHLVLRSLSKSFEHARIGSLPISMPLMELAHRQVIDMVAAGIAFAAPILILLLLVSVTIGLLARAVPQLNILEMSFTLRIGLGLTAMFVFAPLASPVLHGLYASFADALDDALLAMEG